MLSKVESLVFSFSQPPYLELFGFLEIIKLAEFLQRIFHPGKSGMKVVHPRVDPQWKIGGCSNNGNLVFLPTLSAHPGVGVLYNAGRFVCLIM